MDMRPVTVRLRELGTRDRLEAADRIEALEEQARDLHGVIAAHTLHIEVLEAALREIAGRSWHPANVRLGDIARAALDQTPPQRLDSVEAIAKALLMEGRITPNIARALMASAQSPSDGK